MRYYIIRISTKERGYLMTNIIAVPFGYLMRFCYMFTNNYALALIFFTLFFKLLLLPLNIKQHKSSLAQARVRPKERAIRKRYEGRTDPNARLELQNDLMKLYREEKVSVAGGCLPLLIQFPIIIALWEVIQKPLSYLSLVADETINAIQSTIFGLFQAGTFTETTSKAVYELYTKANGVADKFSLTQIQMVDIMKNNSEHFADYSVGTLPDFTIFGGAIDLSQFPSLSLAAGLLIILPFLAAAFQYLSTVISQKFGPKPDMSTPEAQAMAKQMKIMNIIFPVMTLIFAFNLPAIISLYWIYQSIFSTIIQIILSKKYPIPVYTEEEYASIEAEMNRDYVRPTLAASSHRSLHHIDDDDDDYIEYIDKTDDEELTDGSEDVSDAAEAANPSEDVPPRRLYDKDGNKIRSLHYIDEDDE